MVKIDFDVSLEYQVLEPAGADFVLNIHAARTERQQVNGERLTINQPVVPEVATDPATSSRFMRLHADQGLLTVAYSATVTVDHFFAETENLAEVPVRCLPLEVMPYVYPSRYCESDRLLKLAASELGNWAPGYSRVLAIQHWVQKHLTFTSNTTNSTTSAVDTLIERVGVCRDYTHLMIALCRALNMPARIATGTDFGADPALGPPDFHAYVEVYLGDRWYLFDASGTGVPMGFIRVGTGRDAADVAFATIFGSVESKAPLVSAIALEGEGLVFPHHCREALSTTPAAQTADSGCTGFDSRATTLAAATIAARSMPN
jgi:transglutaminase-like putative cysteine protease